LIVELCTLIQKSACASIESSIPGFLDSFKGHVTMYDEPSPHFKNGEQVMKFDEKLEKIVPDLIPERHWFTFDIVDVPDLAALDFPEETITLSCACDDYEIPFTVQFDKSCCIKNVICRDMGATFTFN
jgi:hypothetical protein